jgi:signal peptidase II
LSDKVQAALKAWKAHWLEASLLALLALGLFLVDYFSKDYVFNQYLSEYVDHGYVSLKTAVPYLFDVTLEFNTGAAWSIGSGYTALLALISLAMGIVILVGTVLYFPKLPHFARVALALCLAGDVGNLVDRMGKWANTPKYSRGVIDFIVFDFWKSFPVFNIADSCLVIGIAILIVGYLVVLIQQNLKAKAAKKAAPAVDDSASLKEKLSQRKSADDTDDSSKKV